MNNAPRRKKLSMLLYYPIVAGILALCTLVFALCYSGGGANRLADSNLTAQQNGENDGTGDDAPGPSSTPVAGMATPEPISRKGRIVPYLENGKWGYKNSKGQVVISAQYAAAEEFQGNVAFAAMIGSGLYGLIDLNGNWLVEASYTSVRPFSNGWAAVEKNGYWGYIDETGRTVVEPTFREAGEYFLRKSTGTHGKLWGYIDRDGDLVIDAEWKTSYDFSEDIAFVQSTSDNWHMIDKAGNRIATLGSHISGKQYSEGYAAVSDGNEWFYYNSRGRSAYSKTFQAATAFSGGYAAVKSEGLWGYIDTRGAWAIEPVYQEAQPFSGGLAAVLDAQTGLWGYINSKGEVKIDFQFGSAEPFSGSVARVSLGSEVLLCDKEGNTVSLYYR